MFGLFENGLFSRCFRNLLHGNISDKTAFCLGEKEDTLVNDECSSWYKRVGNFFSVN